MQCLKIKPRARRQYFYNIMVYIFCTSAICSSDEQAMRLLHVAGLDNVPEYPVRLQR